MFNFLKRKPKVAIGPQGFEEGGSARGYERFNKNGERETVIIGEKEVMRGHSRDKFLHGKLGLIKDLTKTIVKALADSEKDMVPQENLKMPVRAMAETFDLLIEAEVGSEPLRNSWRLLKKVFCSFAEEDDTYCFRYQWFMEKLFKRMKDIKLSKADKYYFHSRPDFRWDL